MKQHGLVVALAVVLGLGTQTSIGQEIMFLGSEFQVNSYTSFDQQRPAVAVRPDGSFFIVWQSDGSGGDDTGSLSIQARSFLSDGTTPGDDFQLNTYTTGDQGHPAAAYFPSAAQFINIVWQSGGSTGTDDSGASVQMRRYRGQFTLPELQVNTSTTDEEQDPAIAVGPQGHFVVTWSTDIPYPGIFAQRYASDGAAAGGDFRVDSGAEYYQTGPSVAVGPQGDFVVAWTSSPYDPPPGSASASILGRRFASNGDPLGSEFQINTYTTDGQSGASVAADPVGNFVVVWYSDGSYGTDSSDLSIQARLFASDGNPAGGEFQVNTFTTGLQFNPSVAFGPEGDFLVVWRSGLETTPGPDGSKSSIQGRLFHSDGGAATDEFQINSFTVGDQVSPSVAADPVDRFVVVWQSDGSFGTDNFLTSIQGQRLIMPLFADGFESGGTAVWSSSVP
jgi:hypothetical protein